MAELLEYYQHPEPAWGTCIGHGDPPTGPTFGGHQVCTWGQVVQCKSTANLAAATPELTPEMIDAFAFEHIPQE